MGQQLGSIYHRLTQSEPVKFLYQKTPITACTRTFIVIGLFQTWSYIMKNRPGQLNLAEEIALVTIAFGSAGLCGLSFAYEIDAGTYKPPNSPNFTTFVASSLTAIGTFVLFDKYLPSR